LTDTVAAHLECINSHWFIAAIPDGNDFLKQARDLFVIVTKGQSWLYALPIITNILHLASVIL